MKLNILQVSDLHINNKNLIEIRLVIKALFRDIDKVIKENNLKIDLVMFCGDLISKGEDSDAEIELACDEFFFPLIQKYKIDSDFLFIAPGNHEVNRAETSEPYERGLSGMLNSDKALDDLILKMEEGSTCTETIRSKLESYMEIKETFQGDNLIDSNFFYDTYKFNKNGLSVGVVSLNSAWRSSGFDSDEGKILIGERVFDKATTEIHNCDIRLSLMHHPFEMIPKWNRSGLQRAMAKNINILFTGHIHDSNFEYIEPVFGNLYVSTCGSIYSGRIKNGYSLLSVDLEQKHLKVYLRKWYRDRGEFDQETEKCENGVHIIENFCISSEKTNDLIEINKIKSEFQIEQNTNALIPFSNTELTEFNDSEVFVSPIISDVSNYDKSKNEKTFFDLDDLVGSKQNIIFYGKRESGKSFLLNHIKDEIINQGRKFEGILPAFINFKEVPKRNYKSISNIILKSFEGRCTKSDVEKWLKGGNILLIIDDYDDLSDKDRDQKREVLASVFENYPECRYVMSCTESISQTYKQESINLDERVDAKVFYICPFNTKKIRELLEKWKVYETFDVEKVLRQIVYYFKRLRIPITPMATTLFLGVLFRGSGHKNILNEAYLIENYLETVMEKLTEDSSSSELDFQDKESFLAHIAIRMVEKNKYDWSEIEFEEEKVNYYKRIGEDLPSPRIFDAFFNNQILNRKNRIVSFSVRNWFNFFLAKSMQRSDSVKSYILDKDNYLKFATALAYKAGLDRNDKDLLSIIDARLNAKVSYLLEKYVDKEFQSEKFNEQIVNFSDEVKTELREKNKIEEKDTIRDQRYLSYDEDDQEIEPVEDDSDDIIELVTLNSDVIMNTREMDLTDKEKYLKNNIDCYICLMWETLEEFKGFIEKVDEEEVKRVIFPNGEETEDQTKIQEIFKKLQEIVFKVVPLSVAVYMSDHLGNPKLKNVIHNLILNEKSFIRLFFYSLLCLKIDFKIACDSIAELVKSSKSPIIDFVIFNYLRGFCREHKIHGGELEKAIELMEMVRKKYAGKHKKMPPFVKDTFSSDIRNASLGK